VDGRGEQTLEHDLNSSARTSPHPGKTRATPTGETATARAYLRLKHAVLSGAFRPGEVVTLRGLSPLLGCGETPVREAVKRSLIPSDPTQAWQVACGHHEALLTALQRRDAEAARVAMREDLSALGKIDGYWEGIEDGAGTERMRLNTS
jgi:DNA-binding GntR family transcriptional regulator